ncbi:hypothetical protein [Cohnella thailandensis]|uniref:Uncharacterized protein n=1 Tax=Cohnella thailandensis TaxID=557557 RepID=A0A841SWW3_9BACL|nr:hypothetical protein [Cohnella thailandensis]MBB6635742.1 hypothetical protein [Cohnella thailandensis]MBP1976120.1 hypothetical protein [Cohnella thailandensis]
MFVVILAASLLYSLTASANPPIVSYDSPGTLVTVVERVPGTTTAYPSVSYTITFH